MTASRNRFVPDALLFIQPEGSVAVTASGASLGSLFFPATPNAEYWPASTNTLNQEVGVVINVGAIAGGPVTFHLQADTSPAFAAPVDVGGITATAAGIVVFAVVKETIEALKPAATNFRLYATFGTGATSVTYSAFLSDLKSL